METGAKNKPLISIITVVKNDRDNLKKTIQSVLNQSYKKIEYLIIDGGSSDGTVELIKDYSLQTPCIKWVSEKDEGIYDAMNKGIKLSQGEWLNFLNAGDTYYEDDLIETLWERGFFSAKNDIIYGDAITDFFHFRRYTKALPLESIGYRMCFYHSTAFIKTSLHQAHLYDTKWKIIADYDFFRKMYFQRRNFIYTQYIHSISPIGGYSYNNQSLRYKEIIELTGKRFYYLKEMFLGKLRRSLIKFLPVFIQSFLFENVAKNKKK